MTPRVPMFGSWCSIAIIAVACIVNLRPETVEMEILWVHSGDGTVPAESYYDQVYIDLGLVGAYLGIVVRALNDCISS